ncbi:MAG TPA: peptidoglycan recognition family protein [Geobacteraceae bacterium]|nr:peptidoglycan recognition family protein [Geobacteraceae bacterium]
MRVARRMLFGVVVPLLLLTGLAGVGTDYDPRATQRSVISDERLRLTASYCLTHYGIESAELRDPQLVVVHYTAFATLEESYRFFAPARLDPVSRRDIKGGGAVNVSAHYLIDRDGTVLQLAPDNVVCRHTIGFNWTAIGIENVGRNAADLTAAQASATADLIGRLVTRHPSIAYLIGHHEYRRTDLPHYRLFRENDRSYRFTPKVDPGPAFMGRVRGLLRERHGIVLKD